MATALIKTSFVAGELSPSMQGRPDEARYANGATTFRNMWPSYRGAAYSRAGTAFVGFSKQTGRAYPPRPIPFQFSLSQGLALEFGNFYMRVVDQGAYVTEPGIFIAGISQADPGVLTLAANSVASATANNSAVSADYAAGDQVTIASGVSSTPAVLDVVNTALASLSVNSPGNPTFPTGGVKSYQPGDTVSLQGGVFSSPATIVINTTKVIAAAASATSGSGGTPGPAVVTGTTGTGTPFQANVTIAPSGGLSAVNSIAFGGSYTANPTAGGGGSDTYQEPVTGGGLVGAIVVLTLGINTFSILSGGAFTQNAAAGNFTQNSTTGQGIGATFDNALFGPNQLSIVNGGVYSVFPTSPAAQASTTGSGAGATFNLNQSAATLFASGDWVFLDGIGGMTNLNGQTVVLSQITATTFAMIDVYGDNIDTTGFPAFTSGGSASRIYTLTTPYSEVDLQYLKFVQSADVMSICCVNPLTSTEYPPQDLSRIADDNWSFSSVIPAPSVAPPPAVSGVASSSGTTDYQYVVTSVAGDGTESIASPIGEIDNAVSVAATAGTIQLTWTAVAGIGEYNVYKATPGDSFPPPAGSLFGFAGSAYGTQFLDSNIVQDFDQVPPTHQNPFARGQILNVVVGNAGAGFTQANITYVINTMTGTGAVLQPIVVNGGFAGAVIKDAGQNYSPNDTITIGGAPAVSASGTYTFKNGVGSNPTNGQTIILNFVTWTFVTGIASGNQTLIRNNVESTIQALASDLNASANASIDVATYSVNNLVLTIVYDTPGTGGNSYSLSAGTYGGTVSGATLTGGVAAGAGGATATLEIGPQSGTYPSVPSYFQERRVYAATLNSPDTYFMSQPGSFTNFDSRIPTIASDAIIGAPWSVQVNGIQWLLQTSGGLLVMTGDSAWLLVGVGSFATNVQPISPSSQDAVPQAFSGCSPVIPPIRINYDVIYVESKGSRYYDLPYQLYALSEPVDITEVSSHLFTGFTMIQHAWCEQPNKLLWAVRDDGVMLSLTYYKTQQISGWARHDTNGFFVGVCSIIEPPVDALYVATQRFPGNKTAYMIERMDDRIWSDVEDTWCVDCGLTLAQPEPAATLSVSSAFGLGSITGVTNLIGGGGYSAATAASVVDLALQADGVTPIGSGATVALTIVGGVITGMTFPAGGAAYQQPQINIVDPAGSAGGSGASAKAILNNAAVATASAAVFSAGNVNSVIRSGGGIMAITGFTDSQHVAVDILSPIVVSSAGTPAPQTSGNWTMTAPVTLISGLNHLIGATVTGLADGNVIPPTVVSAQGTITLAKPASAVTVGLGFTAQLQTPPIDAGTPTIAGQRKKMSAVTVRMEASRGVTLGANQIDGNTQSPPTLAPTWEQMQMVADVGSGAPNFPLKPYNALAVPLRTGDARVAAPGGWKTTGQVAVQQINPLPMQIISLIPELLGGDTPQVQAPPKGKK